VISQPLLARASEKNCEKAAQEYCQIDKCQYVEYSKAAGPFVDEQRGEIQTERAKNVGHTNQTM